MGVKKSCRRFVAALICVAVIFTTYNIGNIREPYLANAAKKDDLKNENSQDQDKLDEINSQISDLNSEQEDIDDQIAALSDEIAELMASISLLEDDIEAKKAEIEQAKIDLEEAKRVEEEQYAAMKVRIKAMYESGDTTALDIFFSSSSMQEMMNKADYVEKVHEYDMNLLENYKIARQNVEDLKETLEIEESELESAQDGLKEEMDSVEEARAELQEISDDYDVQISKAKQQAETYKAQIKQRNAEIAAIEKAEEEARKKAEEEARKKAEEEAKKAAQSSNSQTSSTDTSTDTTTSSTSKLTGSQYTVDTSLIQAANGSAKGKEIAIYACQFLGNPYVAGGTDPNTGADCSGFTQYVYKAFGYSIPRTSTSQRSAGVEVSYEDAQPGDIICYPGHVAIYIGNGQIVHASSAKTGIKISNALYRSILCVRRIV
jgi:cell wall-associated NlpC family hydrolase